MARHRSWMAPMNRTSTISVVKPLGTMWGSKMRTITWTTISSSDRAKVVTPSTVIRSRGA